MTPPPATAAAASSQDNGVDELAIQDIASKLAAVEKQSRDKIESLEKQVFNLQAELEKARITRDTPVRDLPCFQKFKRPDGRILTSTAVKETKEWFEYGLRKLIERRDVYEQHMDEVLG